MDNKEDKNKQQTLWFALSLAWQLGYTIAIPLIVFLIIGVSLDKYFKTSPFLSLIAVFFSLIVTTFSVYKKSMKILNQEIKKTKNNQKK